MRVTIIDVIVHEPHFQYAPRPPRLTTAWFLGDYALDDCFAPFNWRVFEGSNLLAASELIQAVG